MGHHDQWRFCPTPRSEKYGPALSIAGGKANLGSDDVGICHAADPNRCFLPSAGIERSDSGVRMFVLTAPGRSRHPRRQSGLSATQGPCGNCLHLLAYRAVEMLGRSEQHVVLERTRCDTLTSHIKCNACADESIVLL
jgi:hypothetical protein